MADGGVGAVEVRLAARPNGWPVPADFEVVDVPVPEPGPGQLLVRNEAISVDPYMRGRMNASRSYAPPYEVGRVMYGGAVGVVVESDAAGFAPGDRVLHQLGWRTHAVLEPRAATPIDVGVAPASAYLGVLGMPGLTAYAGLLHVAGLDAGDTVFVSGAAGAVGSVVGQLARLRGAGRVVGSAGSAAKVAYLVDRLGFDAAFNYRDGPVGAQLAAAAPDGIHVYFDNVGGEHLEAAIDAALVHARFAVCGMISGYNATEPPPGPRNMMQIVGKRLSIRGFLVSDHVELREAFLAEFAPLVGDGTLRYDQTVVDGIGNAPQAFLDMLGGKNTGKMVVRV